MWPALLFSFHSVLRFSPSQSWLINHALLRKRSREPASIAVSAGHTRRPWWLFFGVSDAQGHINITFVRHQPIQTPERVFLWVWVAEDIKGGTVALKCFGRNKSLYFPDPPGVPPHWTVQTTFRQWQQPKVRIHPWYIYPKDKYMNSLSFKSKREIVTYQCALVSLVDGFRRSMSIKISQLA